MKKYINVIIKIKKNYNNTFNIIRFIKYYFYDDMIEKK